MKKIFLSALILIMLSSCVTREKCDRMFPPQVTVKHDSIVTQIKHDSVIRMPGDSAWLKALIECQNGKPVITTIANNQQTGSNSLKPQISYIYKDNWLKVDCKVDSQKVYLTWTEKHVMVSNEKTVVHETKVNYITGWQWFQIWGFRILVILLVAAIAIMYFANKLPKI